MRKKERTKKEIGMMIQRLLDKFPDPLLSHNWYRSWSASQSACANICRIHMSLEVVGVNKGNKVGRLRPDDDCFAFAHSS